MRLAVAFVVLLVAFASSADEPGAQEQAKRHYEEATAAFNIADFSRAADEYREAYKLVHDPVFLYDAAQAYRLGNNPQEALFFYRSYLRGSPTAVNRAEVEERIRVLQQQLSSHPSAAPAAKPTEPAAANPEPAAHPQPAASTEPSSHAAIPTHELAAGAAIHPRRPVYKTWWFWTVIGVVAAGAATGIAVGVTSAANQAPSTTLGVMNVF
jgi:hypothetical protein